MLTIRNIDIQNLRNRLGELARFTKASHDDIVRQQGGLLMRDLVMDAPPQRLSKSQQKAEEFSRNVFAPMPKEPFPISKRGTGMMVWLFSGPLFLLGADRRNYMPDIGSSEMRRLYAIRARQGSFGRRYDRIGKRDPQPVIKLNRIVVSRGALREFNRSLRNSFGKLKGAWSTGWDFIGVKSRLPNWIRRHQNNGKGSYLLTRGENPTLTLVNRSNGVESEYSRRAITHALRKRAGAIAADIRNQLRGNYRKAGFKNSSAKFSLN